MTYQNTALIGWGIQLLFLTAEIALGWIYGWTPIMLVCTIVLVGCVLYASALLWDSQQERKWPT